MMSQLLNDAPSTESGQSLPSYYASHPAETERDASALIHTYLDENSTVVRRGTISHPVCLPQMEVGFDIPFARAYAPALADLGISQEVFLGFIDGLNTAMIASPPLQVVDFAGLVIGFVPHEVFFLVGLGLQAGAQIGIRVLSKTLTDRYMRAANERIFRPAGLRARICKSPAMRALAKVPWVEAPRPSRLKKLAEYMSTVGLWMPPSPPPGHVPVDPRVSDPMKRRMVPYEGYFLPMTFDVPPPDTSLSSSNVVNKLSEYAVNFRRNSLTKRSENAIARRQIVAGVPLSREPTRKDKKVMKKLAKGKEHKMRRKVYKDDRREARANENVLWLVIVNEEEDHLIQGSERVDDSRNEIVFNESEIEKAQKEYQEECEESGDSSSDEDEEVLETQRNGTGLVTKA